VAFTAGAAPVTDSGGVTAGARRQVPGRRRGWSACPVGGRGGGRATPRLAAPLGECPPACAQRTPPPV